MKFFFLKEKKNDLKKDVERRKLAKMLCFEAHQNQSLGEGTDQKIVKKQIPSFHAYSRPGILWKQILQQLNTFAWDQHLEKLSYKIIAVKSTLWRVQMR